MGNYKLLANGKVREPSEGWEIDPANVDDPRVAAYNTWLAGGGIPDPVPVLSAEEQKAMANAPILRQIISLEVGQARGIRDAILRNDKTWIENIDSQIAALRATLQ